MAAAAGTGAGVSPGTGVGGAEVAVVGAGEVAVVAPPQAMAVINTITTMIQSPWEMLNRIIKDLCPQCLRRLPIQHPASG